MITATKPFSPPLEDYQLKIAQIFEKNWFTNHGPFVTELELKLKEFFDVPYLVVVSNGTIALQISIKALELNNDEIITTPYSYVATTNSILWENCKPVFVDIDEDTFNIDPSKIEAKINSKTKAILATHVYGYPCAINRIEEIANRYNLKVIYDAAHCFNTSFNNKSILNFVDISTISFHSTKLFHTIEGGAIVCKEKKIYDKIMQLRNFGHTSTYTFGSAGINGKMNEFCGAMGLTNFNYISEITTKRKEQWLFYFKECQINKIRTVNYSFENIEFNYAYFVVLLENEDQVEILLKKMEKNNIYLRRYFYPSLNQLPYLKKTDKCNLSEKLTKRVVSLPLYHTLTVEQQKLIISILKTNL